MVDCSFCKEPVAWATPIQEAKPGEGQRWICEPCIRIEFMRKHLKLPGDYAGKQFDPLPWFELAVRKVYGTLTPEGLRQIEAVYQEIGKGNAKTASASALVICELNSAARPIEVYSAATAKEQAAITFECCEQMIKQDAYLEARLVIMRSKKIIYRRDNPSIWYKALSADGRFSDGMNPQFVVRDELHLWKTAAQRMLYNVIERSKMKRKNPLIWDISTAGEEGESELCWERHEYVRMIEEGLFQDPAFWGKVYQADPRKIAKDPEYWKTREAFLSANPSHVAFGGYIQDKVWSQFVREATLQPSKKVPYMRYHLNYWGTSDDSVIDMEAWRNCPGDVDMTEFPAYEEDYLVSKWDLVNRECFLGLDLGSTTDMTALAAIFPPHGRRKFWAVLMRYWMPMAKVAVREAEDKFKYSNLVERGFIDLAPGSRTNPDVIIPCVRRWNEMFTIRSFGYDPANADSTMGRIVDEMPDIEHFAIPQQISHLNEPTGWLLYSYVDGQDSLLGHGNHPVLMWNARNLRLTYDKNGNCKPAKVFGQKKRRIDGIAAVINAIQRSMVTEESFVRFNGVKSVG